MPAYNFKPRFAPSVESGTKRHTLRPRRKRPTQKGDVLYLYTGMRTKSCRLLLEVSCTEVKSAIVSDDYVLVDGKKLSEVEASQLALDDGFTSFDEFVQFFKTQYGSLPVELDLICW